MAKMLDKPDSYTGSDAASWRAWSRSFRGYFSLVFSSASEPFFDALSETRTEITALDEPTWESRFPGVVEIQKILYQMLDKMMAQSILHRQVTSVPHQRGLEAFRRLERAADPCGDIHELGSVQALLRTTAVTDVVNGLITAIAEFDNKLDIHLRRGGDALADKTLASAYLSLIPDDHPLREHISLTRASYADAASLKQFLLSYCLGKQSAAAAAALSGAMDLSPFGKGKGKDKNGSGSGKDGHKANKFQGTCNHCGKPGHKMKECWRWQAEQQKASSSYQSSSSSSGGKGGKGGAKGGGKFGGGKGGGGKPKGKGKSKGVNAVVTWDDDWAGAWEDDWAQGNDEGQDDKGQEEEATVGYLINSLLTLSSLSSSLVVESSSVCLPLSSLGSQVIAIMIDSGAAISACPESFMKTLGRELPTRYQGRHFVAASGHKIAAIFSRALMFTARDEFSQEHSLGVRFEACAVKKPIISVSELTRAGHRTVLDEQFPHIVLWCNKPWQAILPLHQALGTFWLLVKPKDASTMKITNDEMVCKVVLSPSTTNSSSSPHYAVAPSSAQKYTFARTSSSSCEEEGQSFKS